MMTRVAIVLAAMSMSSVSLAQTAAPIAGEATPASQVASDPSPQDMSAPGAPAEKAAPTEESMCIRRTFFSVAWTPFRAVTNTLVRVVNRNAPPARHLCGGEPKAPAA